MPVTIMYRNNWFEGDGWTYYPVTVEISAFCPVCGEKRGKPVVNRYCEDGEYYVLDNWENPCGHFDGYQYVYRESLKINRDNE